MQLVGKPHRRVPGWTFIAVPSVGLVQHELVVHLRQAARLALLKESKPRLVPVAPLLYLGSLLTEDELNSRYMDLADMLLARTDRIWLYAPKANGVVDLDYVTYQVLEKNQCCANRRAVYRVHMGGSEPVIEPLRPKAVEALLRANLAVGVAHQVA